MFNKIAIILFVSIFSSNLFAHNVASFDIQITNLENDYSSIMIKNLRSKKSIWGNQVKIISKRNNRVIKEFILTKENNKYKTPNEDYHVVIKVGNNLVFENPTEENKTFSILLGIVVILLVILGIVIFKINKRTKLYL